MYHSAWFAYDELPDLGGLLLILVALAYFIIRFPFHPLEFIQAACRPSVEAVRCAVLYEATVNVQSARRAVLKAAEARCEAVYEMATLFTLALSKLGVRQATRRAAQHLSR